MNPILVLKCKGSYDSFKFEDRQVQLDSGGAPVKVGRSQGALKPRGDNAIFECRVLSRSHAQVWCEEGVFFIKDTGSSNGTFVNQQRVHQEPVQIKTGDVLQFGVDVDNNPKHTYWCVVTQIICGEANYSFSEPDWDVGINQYTKANSQTAAVTPRRSVQPVGQAHQPVDEVDPAIEKANHQVFHSLMSVQQSVEGKFATIQRVVSEIDSMQRDQYNESLNNDVLLTRIENLERKLQGCNVVDQPELMLKYHQLVDEKSDLETTSKQTLKRMMNEKMDIQNRHEALKKSLNQSEEEAEQSRDKLSRAERQMQQLLEDEQKLRIDLSARANEASAEREKLERVQHELLQEKQRFNIPNAINMLLTEADHISEDDGERIIRAFKPEQDSTSDFVREEHVLQLENVIKSQALNLAAFFDALPGELGLLELDQIVAHVRESTGKMADLETERQCLVEEMNVFKSEKMVTEEHMTRQITDHRTEVVKLEELITAKEADITEMHSTLEHAQGASKQFSPHDPKTQIILCLLSLIVLLVAMLLRCE